jgi:ABC-2 type transport system permease protein
VKSIGVWTVLTVKQLLRSRFYLILALLQPLFFLTVAALMSGARGERLGATLAATTIMGMWSTTLFGAGRALHRERVYGTLELLLISPRSLLRPVLGVCLGSSALAVASAGSGLVAATVLFGFRTSWVRLALFAPALLVGVLGLAALGTLLCASFVLMRQATALSNTLEYPVWFACALLIPPDARPAPVALAGEFLAPTHVSTLMNAAVVHGGLDRLACAKLAVLCPLYVGAAVLLFDRVTKIVRRRGGLTLG